MVTVITSTMNTNSPLITIMYRSEDKTDGVVVVVIVAGELEDEMGIVDVASIEVPNGVVTCTIKVKLYHQ